MATVTKDDLDQIVMSSSFFLQLFDDTKDGRCAEVLKEVRQWYLDKVTALFARIIAQLGPEFSYYVHKVSKAITPDLLPVQGDGFAAAVDKVWRDNLGSSGLRDKTLTLTIIHRPPSKSFLGYMNRSAPERFKEQTRKRVRRLREAVGVFTSGLADLKPRVLCAASGELVGFLGSLNTGRELPLYPANRYGFLAYICLRRSP